MKKITAVLAASAAAVVLVSCSSGDDASNESDAARTTIGGAASSLASAASSVAERARGAFDEAKLATFVAAFRTGYPNLAADRDDASIEAIVIETCPLIDSGASDQEVIAKVGELAQNGDTAATEEQAGRISQLVRVAC
ncbi:hypothetical protein [Rhodococcus sp. GXMU-t2271]|uniref:hypothetical protein n=1 Tax=Rhodococcus TaxID=1827 RepID=UPI00352B7766